jgi:pimeloyl-ACP methyl ester carboxylesterase
MIYILPVLLLACIFFLLRPAYSPAIKPAPPSAFRKPLAELRKIEIGDASQWITIRATNTDNPLLLFLHGGPGTSQLTLNRHNTKSLESHFIIVNWDQRGAGKSYAAIKDKQRMNIQQFVSDTIELSEYLLKRFGKQKLVLAGHSWGSGIGMLAAAQRPDLFSAYIGIGQIACMTEGEKISYQWTLEQAIKRGDRKAEKTLKKIGPPPYSLNGNKCLLTQRGLLRKFGGEFHGSLSAEFKMMLHALLFSPEYTFMDRINYFKGIFGSIDLLWEELMLLDLTTRVPEVKMPVWFMLGRYDYEVPSILAEEYFRTLRAPAKTLVWFENSAHMPNAEERELFNSRIREQVLPCIS